MMDLDNALNEYYSLKNKFETDLDNHKKKILHMEHLSNKEKRTEFSKLKPKCVNCKKPSKDGTLFSVERVQSETPYRVLKCSCGNVVNPCPLNIEIHLADTVSLETKMNTIQEEIRLNKMEIIENKNKLLFGIITPEEALEEFEFNKEYISELTNVYGHFLNMWHTLCDNPEKKANLDNLRVQLNTNIDQIKEYIVKMNETNDTFFAGEVARIYVNALVPLLEQIRNETYLINVVFQDDTKFRLVQRKCTLADIPTNVIESKVVHFHTGLEKESVQDLSVKPSPVKDVSVKPSSPPLHDSQSSQDSQSSSILNVESPSPPYASNYTPPFQISPNLQISPTLNVESPPYATNYTPPFQNSPAEISPNEPEKPSILEPVTKKEGDSNGDEVADEKTTDEPNSEPEPEPDNSFPKEGIKIIKI